MQYIAFLIQYNSRTPLTLEQKRLLVRLHIQAICIGTFVKLMKLPFSSATPKHRDPGKKFSVLVQEPKA
ncbi:hypothetical protein Pyn_35550 [Prunus yedoensis var. nudiflora]|uniref:Uncharacterized protein n=1 Tax=Prunus yedoensis var. nudiflora TaxID=2094558 RepID=A0A314Y0F5_PRUYE|nr:hypothetical protein Pyn_35550 [Prunus yedoensis var. nudiflora]